MSGDMALVATKSQNGAYDDESFLAGLHCGVLTSGLAQNSFPDEFLMALYKKSIRQADLIAMNHGYLTNIMEEFELWSLVRFKKSASASLEEITE